MPHIHTQPGDHDFTASAFIVFDDSGTWKVLLLMHKKVHKWIQPGGHIETNETPWQAVAHEVLEETGLDIDKDLQVFLSPPLIGLTVANEEPTPFALNTHDFIADMDHKHTDLSYAFVSNTEVVRPAEGESQEYKWFSLDEIKALPDSVTPQNVRELAAHVLTAIIASHAVGPSDTIA